MPIDPLFGIKAAKLTEKKTSGLETAFAAVSSGIDTFQRVQANQLTNETNRLNLNVARELAPIKINSAVAALRQSQLNIQKTEQLVEAGRMELDNEVALQPHTQAAYIAASKARAYADQTKLTDLIRNEEQKVGLEAGLNALNATLSGPLVSPEEAQAITGPSFEKYQQLEKDRNALQSSVDRAPDSAGSFAGAFSEFDRRKKQALAEGQRALDVVENERATATAKAFFGLIDRNPNLVGSPQFAGRFKAMREQISNSPATRSAVNSEVARRSAPMGVSDEVKAIVQGHAMNLDRVVTGEEIQATYAATAEAVQQGRVFEAFPAPDRPLVQGVISSMTDGTAEQVANRQANLSAAALRGVRPFKEAGTATMVNQMTATQQTTFLKLSSAAEGLARAEELYANLVKANPSLAGGSLTGKAFAKALKTLRKTDPNVAALETALGTTVAGFVQSVSGAAVTDQEFKRLESFFGNWDEGQEPFAAKMAELRRSFNTNLVNLGTSSNVPKSSVEYLLSDQLQEGGAQLSDTDQSVPKIPMGYSSTGTSTPGGIEIYTDADGDRTWLHPSGQWKKLAN